MEFLIGFIITVLAFLLGGVVGMLMSLGFAPMCWYFAMVAVIGCVATFNWSSNPEDFL